MTAISVHQVRGDSRSSFGIKQMAAALALVLTMFAMTTLPVSDVVPDSVDAAISAVMPDFVADFLAVGEADAFGWNWVAFTAVVSIAVVVTVAACGATAGFGCAVGVAAVKGASAGVVGYTGGWIATNTYTSSTYPRTGAW